jgi:peroxiredoxin
MLSDWPQDEVIKAYDVWNPERYTARRTTFVIDKEGVIRGVIESETDMMIHAWDALRIVQELEGATT